MSIREVKVCLLGDIGVGKSSLVGRFVHNSFNPNLTTTLGASFMSKSLTVDNNTIKFQIWDTAGQERDSRAGAMQLGDYIIECADEYMKKEYRSLLPMYYRNAAAAIVVYDITNEATFDVLQEWIKELNRLGPPDIVLAIAANKCDLEDKREVQYSRGEQYAQQVDALFCETSALNSTNVEELFIEICRKLPPEQNSFISGGHQLLKPSDEPKRKCCRSNT